MSNPGFNKTSKLYELAKGQGGYFTAAQAVNLGFDSKNHHLRLKDGSWVREMRGIYSIPWISSSSELETYWIWYLWSHNRDRVPQGCFSHETALSIHGLSDVNPSRVYMTVNNDFRRQSKIPKGLTLIKKKLENKDKKKYYGYEVTTVIRTLTDIIEEGTLSDEFIQQATRDALEKGYITRNQLRSLPELARYAV